MIEGFSPYRRFVLGIPVGAIVTGLTALVLLPVGALLGVGSFPFSAIFFVHFTLLLLAGWSSLLFLHRLLGQGSFPPTLAWGILLLFLLIILGNGLLPPTAPDALLHHLAVPRWWAIEGSLAPFPWHEWSFYPALVNLGFTALLARGLESWTAAYHALYLLVTCGVLAGFAWHRFRHHETAVVAFLLTLTLPLAVRLAAAPLADLGTALYTAAAFALIVYGVEARRLRSLLILGGFALGLALGTKYLALLTTAALLPALVLYLRRSGLRWGRTLRCLALVGASALLTCLPWAARNVWWTGNPLYPLMSGILRGTPAGRGLTEAVGAGHLITGPESTWLELLLTPVMMLLFGRDADPAHFDGVLSPLLLLCIIPAWRLRREPWFLFLGATTLLYAVGLASLSTARARYILPVLLPVIVLAARGVFDTALLFKRRYERRIVGALLGAHLAVAIVYAVHFTIRAELAGYLMGRIDRATYLSARLPDYGMITWMNEHLPPSSYTALLFAGDHVYYHAGRVIPEGHSSSHPILQWLKDSPRASFLAAELVNRNIDYLMVDGTESATELTRLLSPQEYQEWQVFNRDHLELLHQIGRWQLWQVRQGQPEGAG